MMLAVQDGIVALRVIVCVDLGHLPWCGTRHGHRQVFAVAHPGALLARGSFNVEAADGFAVCKKLVFDVARKGKREWAGEIYIRVLEVVAVINADGHEAAGFGMSLVAGPLEDRDGAHCGRVIVGLCDLAWILRGTGKRGREKNQKSHPP